MMLNATGGGLSSTYPIGGQTPLDLDNPHTVYALTWFSLSGIMSVACWFLLRGGRNSFVHPDGAFINQVSQQLPKPKPPYK